MPVTATQGEYCSDNGSVGKKPGLCFLCRKPGHWKMSVNWRTTTHRTVIMSNLDFVTYDNILKSNRNAKICYSYIDNK